MHNFDLKCVSEKGMRTIHEW